MAEVTICSYFGALQNKVYHWFHCFPIYLHEVMQSITIQTALTIQTFVGKVTQGSNSGIRHCRQILYHLSHKGSPRILECVAYPFSRGSSQPRNRKRVSCSGGGFFTSWATREAPRGIYRISIKYYFLRNSRILSFKGTMQKKKKQTAKINLKGIKSDKYVRNQ